MPCVNSNANIIAVGTTATRLAGILVFELHIFLKKRGLVCQISLSRFIRIPEDGEYQHGYNQSRNNCYSKTRLKSYCVTYRSGYD